MFRIAASALALASASLVASAPAEAAAKCTCVKTHKARTHHRAKPRHRTVAKAPKAVQVVTTTVVTRDIADAPTYVVPIGDVLPDPQHDDHPVWSAAGGEIEIASALNASLDLWRTCAWKGQDEAAATFVMWSRTHLVEGRGRTAHASALPAWKAFGLASARRVSYMDEDEGFNTQPTRCDVGQAERASLRADMDAQARALAKAHAIAHSDRR